MSGTAKYRKQGLCAACGKVPELGKKKCTECLLKSQAYSNARAQRLKAQQLCVACAKPHDRFPHVLCTSCNSSAKGTRDKQKIACITAYGGKCQCCGESIPEFLSIDHVNNDGAEHRRKIARERKSTRRTKTGYNPPQNGQGVRIYCWLIRNNFPVGFTCLCMNCNFAKGKFGECPHQRMRREQAEQADTTQAQP